jgi:hypothetical protein
MAGKDIMGTFRGLRKIGKPFGFPKGKGGFQTTGQKRMGVTLPPRIPGCFPRGIPVPGNGKFHYPSLSG